ncbi:MAG TPA: hypothetical protein PLB73_09165, partial [Leptospiraceae bacterium]|nr:hypothetical protein [Leptospiraceae bacterium]
TNIFHCGVATIGGDVLADELFLATRRPSHGMEEGYWPHVPALAQTIQSERVQINLPMCGIMS